MMGEPLGLMEYEIEALRRAAELFDVEEETLAGFGRSMNALAVLYMGTARATTEYREGRVVMLGLMNHTHHLLAGGLQALEAGNSIVWSSCVRGLIEVYGATVLIREQPGKVVNHLGRLSAGRLYTAAQRGDPALKGDLERLHSVVHPGSGSMWAGVEPTDRETRSVNLEFGLRPVKPADGREGVTVLANLAGLLEEGLSELSRNPAILSEGRVLMRREGTAETVRAELMKRVGK